MSGYDRFAAVYDQLTGNVGYAQRADYLFMLLKNAGADSGTLLDLACGTGSLTVEFCKKGFEVIAVDLSEDMLLSAREKLAPFGDKALILCQDMCELDLFGTVNCAVCSLDSINHLDNIKEVKTAFEKVSLFIEPGGVFVFDVNTLYKHSDVLADNTFVYECADAFLVWQNSLQENGRSVDIMLDIFTQNENGLYERESEDFTETAYSEDEIKEALLQAGFTDIEVFDDLSFDKPSETSQRVYFTAKKK